MCVFVLRVIVKGDVLSQLQLLQELKTWKRRRFAFRTTVTWLLEIVMSDTGELCTSLDEIAFRSFLVYVV